MRRYLNVMAEAFRPPEPYPQRPGNSVAAWKQHVIDVMQWKERKYGADAFPWRAAIGAEISAKTGVAAVKQLADAGVVQAEFGSERLSGLPTYGHFGKVKGFGRSEETAHVILSPGANFPGTAPTNEADEAPPNKIKAKLAKELEKLSGARASFNVPGFRQKGSGLNLASSNIDWAKDWRNRLLNDLPDSVAEVRPEEIWYRSGKGATSVTWNVYYDADGTPLVAVAPKKPSHIFSYVKLDGKPLKQVVK